MPEPRTPQDHKSKAAPVDEYFTFTSGGEEFTMPNKTLDVINTRFVRLNRRRDETDYALTAIEELAGEGKEYDRIMDAFDSLSRDELTEVLTSFGKHLGASLGE